MLIIRFSDLKSSTGNIALRRNASQSSTYSDQTAGLAVDGSKNKYTRTRCKKAPDEWLAVDLGEQYRISQVVVTNRQEGCGNMNTYCLFIANLPLAEMGSKMTIGQKMVEKLYTEDQEK